MTEDIYRELQKRLDTYSMGFPAAESGIEIKILKYLFDPEDAKMFLDMGPQLETPEAVAARTGRPEAETASHLENMSRRGLLFRLEKGGVIKYGAIPFVHGLFEFQVKDLKKDFALLVEEYLKEAFNQAMVGSRGYFLRTVPVQRSVDPAHHVAAWDDAAKILAEKQDQIVVTDCICRKHKATIEDGCGKNLEACFMFGSMGQYYLDRDMGRKIDLEEALAILAKCQEDGLVTQPATSRNPGGMCNCCGDCCGVLRALNEHPAPAEVVFSNHLAFVDQEECIACEACLERCQMDALFMNDDDKAEVRTSRCIGCGLCVSVCPSEAMKLQPKPEGERRTPPQGAMEQMMSLAKVRGLI